MPAAYWDKHVAYLGNVRCRQLPTGLHVLFWSSTFLPEGTRERGQAILWNLDSCLPYSPWLWVPGRPSDWDMGDNGARPLAYPSEDDKIILVFQQHIMDKKHFPALTKAVARQEACREFQNGSKMLTFAIITPDSCQLSIFARPQTDLMACVFCTAYKVYKEPTWTEACVADLCLFWVEEKNPICNPNTSL